LRAAQIRQQQQLEEESLKQAQQQSSPIKKQEEQNNNNNNNQQDRSHSVETLLMIESLKAKNESFEKDSLNWRQQKDRLAQENLQLKVFPSFITFLI